MQRFLNYRSPQAIDKEYTSCNNEFRCHITETCHGAFSMRAIKPSLSVQQASVFSSSGIPSDLQRSGGVHSKAPTSVSGGPGPSAPSGTLLLSNYEVANGKWRPSSGHKGRKDEDKPVSAVFSPFAESLLQVQLSSLV